MTTWLRCPMNCRALFSHEWVSANARQASLEIRSAPRQASRRSSCSTPIGLLADHVQRAGHRKGRDRHAAGERLELHDPERVGPAGKDEDVGSREMRRKISVFQQAKEFRVGKPAPQLRLLRTLADDDLRAGQVERQERFEVLLDRDPPEADERSGAEGRDRWPVPA